MVDPDSRTASAVRQLRAPQVRLPRHLSSHVRLAAQARTTTRTTGGTGNLSNLSSHVRLAAQARPTPRTVTPIKLRGLIKRLFKRLIKRRGLNHACKSFKKRKALISPLISP